MGSHSKVEIRQLISCRSRLGRIKPVRRSCLLFRERALPAFLCVYKATTSPTACIPKLFHSTFSSPASARAKATHSSSRPPKASTPRFFGSFGNGSVAHSSALDQLRSYVQPSLSPRTLCGHEIGHGLNSSVCS